MSGFELNDKQRRLMAECTHMQALFTINYARLGMSKVGAWRAAGGTAKDNQTERIAASDMFRKPSVRAFYDSLMEAAASEAVMSREEALTRLSRAARVVASDVVDIETEVDDQGRAVSVVKVKAFSAMTPEAKSAIKSVKQGRYGVELQLHDPLQAIKQLADLQGWEPPKKIEGELSITEIRRRIIDADTGAV